MPYRSGDIMVEVFAQTADIAHFHFSVLSGFSAHSEVNICNHKPLLVGLIAITWHGNPCKVLTVWAPYRVGVITALLGDGGR